MRRLYLQASEVPSEAIVVRILSVTAKNGKQLKNRGKFLRHKFKTRGAATASLLNGLKFFSSRFVHFSNTSYLIYFSRENQK